MSEGGLKGYGPKKFILEVKHKKKKAQSGVKIQVVQSW